MIEIVRTLALVPEEALNNQELIELMLPPLKADFALSETYRYAEETGVAEQDGRLACPIFALGGLHDDIVSEENLKAWEQHTKSAFTLKMFDDGHFYTQSHRDELLDVITEQLMEDLDALPKSILVHMSG